jgi:NADH-quinone oxidoreductase subunit J
MELSSYLEYLQSLSVYLTPSNITFFVLAAIILVCGLLSVTTTKILRAATYLFFVLVAIAGLYMLMNYQFLAAVQLSVYAGGIVVLFVFAILLVQRIGEETEKITFSKKTLSAIAAVSGIVLCIALIFGFGFIYDVNYANQVAEGINMQQIGHSLMGTEKYQYLLPFEAAGVLLLACIVGSVIIAQKNKEDKK